MDKTIIVAILAIFACGGFWTFLQSRMQRHDKKQDDREALNKKLDKLERDGLRTQLLLLILMRPAEQQEILTIAEHYFKKPPEGLGGDWYMTSVFNKWVEAQGLAKPEWFDKEG